MYFFFRVLISVTNYIDHLRVEGGSFAYRLFLVRMGLNENPKESVQILTSICLMLYMDNIHTLSLLCVLPYTYFFRYSRIVYFL